MGRTINTADLHNVVLQRKKEYGKLADVIDGAIEEMVAATPTTDRTNQDFIDRCRECGKTAITLAENDEILNEAWSLLVNVTEEDGVTTAEANGMLKLMAFFFYKYHGLKKKPEWVESVEARLANPMAKEYKMHPIKDGFPKTNSGRYLVQDTDGRIPLDKVKQARAEIEDKIYNYPDRNISEYEDCLAILDKLIESEDKE